MKYKNIGAFKNVQNVPYCKATVDMKVGMGVILDREAKTASLPDTSAQDCVYIVTNINDKPEIHNSNLTRDVKAGEFVRADYLLSVDGQEAEFCADEITGGTTGLAKDDALVFGADGLLVKVADATGYAVSFKVIKLTAYKGDGVLVEIVAH